METSTQADQHPRELTKAEIELSHAQILERLSRCVAASRKRIKESKRLLEQDVDSGTEAPAFQRQFRKEFNLPDGVYVFGDVGGDDGNEGDSCRWLFPYIKSWVKGELLPEEVFSLLFFFSEFEQHDYGWIFLDKPMFFYGDREIFDGEPEFKSFDEISKEIQEIGTRSKKKHRKMNLTAILRSMLSGREPEDELKIIEKLKKEGKWDEI